MSSQPNITVLPYIPPADDGSAAHFDNHQFVRRVKAVSKDSEIDFSDIRRAHVITHYSRYAAWIPPFAKNEAQLRHVLADRAWRYACRGRNGLRGGSRPVPAELVNDLQALKRMVDHTFLTSFHEVNPEHTRAVTRAGGYLEYISSIAYRAWSLGLSSPEIALQMDIRPTTVREQLMRLRDAARHLGYEVGRDGPNFRGGERVLAAITRRNARAEDARQGTASGSAARPRSGLARNLGLKLL